MGARPNIGGCAVILGRAAEQGGRHECPEEPDCILSRCTVAAVGAVLALSGNLAGTSLVCLSVLIGAFTVIIARGRGPGK